MFPIWSIPFGLCCAVDDINSCFAAFVAFTCVAVSRKICRDTFTRPLLGWHAELDCCKFVKDAS
jgi:hypothetical protein